MVGLEIHGHSPAPPSESEPNGLVEAGLAEDHKLPKSDAIQRYEGPGEMRAKKLWQTTMNPANRVLMQVTLDDAATPDELFSVLTGEDVESRRLFITRNASLRASQLEDVQGLSRFLGGVGGSVGGCEDRQSD